MQAFEGLRPVARREAGKREGGKETCRRKVNERTVSSAIPPSTNLCIGGDQGSGLGGDIGSSGIGARARAAAHLAAVARDSQQRHVSEGSASLAAPRF
jgi:hypothetical protein